MDTHRFQHRKPKQAPTMKSLGTPTLLLLLTLAWPARGETPADALRALGGKVVEKNGVVVELSVDTAAFTDADFDRVGACTTLRKLSLNGKTLTDATLPRLARLTALEELSTNGSALTDDGYRHFEVFTNLVRLALWHPSFGSPTFTGAGLAHLKALPKLERLTFAGTTTGDAALEAVGQLTQLKEFSTWHTAQTQAGNEFLTRLPRLTRLKIGQRLPKYGQTSPASLDGTTLPVLARIPSLETLELMETRLTAADLAGLKEAKGLKKLVIQQVDIPAADIDAVRAALPSVTVDFKPMGEQEKEELLGKKLKLPR